MFIETVDPDQADGAVAGIYESVAASWGFLPNWARVFAVRPRVLAAWQQLNGTLAGDMDRRRYELATLAAACELGSTYCALAHTQVLRDRFHSDDEIAGIVTDPDHTGALDATDRAVMVFAARVARDATTVTAADLDPLRACGLSDPEILDVAMAAAARSFFTKVLDSVGTSADAPLGVLFDPAVTAALTVGRPIAEA